MVYFHVVTEAGSSFHTRGYSLHPLCSVASSESSDLIYYFNLHKHAMHNIHHYEPQYSKTQTPVYIEVTTIELKTASTWMYQRFIEVGRPIPNLVSLILQPFYSRGYSWRLSRRTLTFAVWEGNTEQIFRYYNHRPLF